MMVVTAGRESLGIYLFQPEYGRSAMKSYLHEKLMMLTDGKA